MMMMMTTTTTTMMMMMEISIWRRTAGHQANGVNVKWTEARKGNNKMCWVSVQGIDYLSPLLLSIT